MIKQVEYDFRLLKVSAVDPSASREKLDEIVNGYLRNGWEIFDVHTIHYEANEAFSAYHFIRYADIPEETPKSK